MSPALPMRAGASMFGQKGNPQARNLFEIIAYLQKREGVSLEVRPARRP